MILKIWSVDGGWVYFDRIERISIYHKKALSGDDDQGYEGGIYTSLKKPFKVATINRTWSNRIEGEFIELAFGEAYLLGDDGHTIERL